MVAGDEEDVAIAQPRQQRRQPGVEGAQGLGITRWIAPVAEVLVALHQIDEEQPGERPRHRGERRRLSLGVGGGVVAGG